MSSRSIQRSLKLEDKGNVSAPMESFPSFFIDVQTRQGKHRRLSKRGVPTRDFHAFRYLLYHTKWSGSPYAIFFTRATPHPKPSIFFSGQTPLPRSLEKPASIRLSPNNPDPLPAPPFSPTQSSELHLLDGKPTSEFRNRRYWLGL